MLKIITTIKDFKIFEVKRTAEEYEKNIRAFVIINPKEITQEETYSQIRGIRGIIMTRPMSYEQELNNEFNKTLKMNIKINMDYFIGLDEPILDYIKKQIKKIHHIKDVSLRPGKFKE